MVPIHKRPEADYPPNAFFDRTASRLRVRSEHCMGALKGRWPSLRGLRLNLNDPRDHLRICNWISCCILLHNAVLDIDGWVAGAEFLGAHGREEEEEDRGGRDEPIEYDAEDMDEDDPGARRRELVAELWAAKQAGLVK